MKIFLFIFFTFAAINFDSENTPLESQFQEALSAASLGEDSKLIDLVLNHRQKLIPLVEGAMKEQSDEDIRSIALSVLVLIGGEEAKRILKTELERVQDVEEKAGIRGALCALMGSTRTKADEEFLIQSLRGPVLSDEGEVIGAAIEPAALTLGIMRSKKAVPALEKCEKEDTGGIAGHACGAALGWIKKKSFFSSSGVSDKNKDPMLFTIFKAGIPRTNESNVFWDEKRGVKWVFSENEWKAIPLLYEGTKKDIPKISFNERVSRDGLIAIVDVGLYFGHLNGKGYIYVVEHKEGTWYVRQIVSSWIS